jgi:2-deoxy-D-gluconate 3-dehydrogenase
MSILDKFSLKGKVAVVTGTTKGLGKSLAEGLMQAGAIVVALDRSENSYLKGFSKQNGLFFERMKIDLLKINSTKANSLIGKIYKKHGRVDILVNNAGITRRGEVEEFSDKDWDDVMQVNLHAAFYLSKSVAKIFIQQKCGKIINLASMLSFQGGMRVPSYVVSKHGVVGLTRSLANGLGKYGINVNAIAPGFMATDLTLPLRKDKARNEGVLARVALGRWGIGEDLKGAVVFLASSASDYLNGAIIPVDGGYLCA